MRTTRLNYAAVAAVLLGLGAATTACGNGATVTATTGTEVTTMAD